MLSWSSELRMGKETLKNSVKHVTRENAQDVIEINKRLTSFSLELVGKPPRISRNGDKTGNFQENE